MTPTRPEPPVYEKSFPVREDDIDQLGHVNNVVYVRWIQDVAGEHWRSLTSEADRRGLSWVVRRHEVDYERPAMPGDRIRARTWVADWTGVTSDRRTELLRESDGTLLARARTLWVAVDPESGRPRRLPGLLRDRFRSEALGEESRRGRIEDR